MADQKASEPGGDELVAKLEEELRRLTVSDILLQTALTLSSLGFRKLSEEERDLAQARMTIEGLKVIVPLLGDAVSEQTIGDLKQMIAGLQLAYATAVSESADSAADPDSASQPA